jgi:hypothetical protein
VLVPLLVLGGERQEPLVDDVGLDRESFLESLLDILVNLLHQLLHEQLRVGLHRFETLLAVGVVVVLLQIVT